MNRIIAKLRSPTPMYRWYVIAFCVGIMISIGGVPAQNFGMNQWWLIFMAGQIVEMIAFIGISSIQWFVHLTESDLEKLQQEGRIGVGTIYATGEKE